MLHKLLARVFAALTLGIVSFGFGSRTASAEVTMNAWIPTVSVRDNPCEAGTNFITFEGQLHQVWYTTPEGTLKMNIHGRLTGVDSDGTEYVVNIQRHMEHFAFFTGPSIYPFNDTHRSNLISKGSTANAQIVITFTMSIR